MNEESKPKEEKKKAKKEKLVKMTRGDTVADVHPSEVDNYKKAGYE